MRFILVPFMTLMVALHVAMVVLRFWSFLMPPLPSSPPLQPRRHGEKPEPQPADSWPAWTDVGG
jgi:hypothetical protein